VDTLHYKDTTNFGDMTVRQPHGKFIGYETSRLGAKSGMVSCKSH